MIGALTIHQDREPDLASVTDKLLGHPVRQNPFAIVRQNGSGSALERCGEDLLETIAHVRVERRGVFASNRRIC